MTARRRAAAGSDPERSEGRGGPAPRAVGRTRSEELKKRRRIIGVDGEGQDVWNCKKCKRRVPAIGGACPLGGEHVLTHGCRKCGQLDPIHSQCEKGGEHDLRVVADDHIYTYLAAVDEYGRLVGEAYNPTGLTHEQCAAMLVALPKNTLKFGFMFSYDVTKIIQELPEKLRYYLMRPSARESAMCKNRKCREQLSRGATQCLTCGGTKIKRSNTPVEYAGRSYDYFHGSMTIEGNVDGRPRSTKIWDCFRFFGVAFVEALRSWSSCKNKSCDDGKGSPGLSDKIDVQVLRKDPRYATYTSDDKLGSMGKVWRCRVCGHVAADDGNAPVATADEIAQIAAMKLKRGAFDVEDPEDVKRYCRNECRLLARMLRRLIDAHERADIPLKRYDGAGSTASALLRKHGVEVFKGPKHRELDPDLAHAVECAFFGGRFEDSVVGLVALPVHGYDISSAYPYAETHLPCLACGFWSLDERMTKAKMEAIVARGGLVLARYAVRAVDADERKSIAWCPLPFRSEKGSISYGTNFSGWSWAPEMLAALEGWPDLVRLAPIDVGPRPSESASEVDRSAAKVDAGRGSGQSPVLGAAWVYETKCFYAEGNERHRPFAFLPEVYRQRNAWGKDGAGIVLKLGMNACVTGDTLVRTVFGEERIDVLVGAGVDVVGADGELHPAASVHLVGDREVYRLRTLSGLELRLTADHLVMTENRGDVRAWELTPDDEIATATGIDRLLSFGSAGVEAVYDLTEVDTFHFVANGIIIHNSYGKTAQSIGENPPFQSWIWAGMTTATTRGQLLQAIASAKDRWNVLAVATDGIFALEELPLKEPPRDTGTSDMKKPLGGWEYKSAPEGIFLAKPGLYYSLEQESKNAFVRARGVGRREVKELHELLENGFAKWDRVDPDYAVEIKSRRFYGAKHSIYGRTTCKRCELSWPGVPEQRCSIEKGGCGRSDGHFEAQMIKTTGGREAYGTWDERTVMIAFDPYPKREREGLSKRGPFCRLHVRDLGGEESAAYEVGTAKTTPEGEAARKAKDHDMEQPDWPR